MKLALFHGAWIAAAMTLGGCSFVAISAAPRKLQSAERTSQAQRADEVFWRTLHAGDYDGIPSAQKILMGAYLADPGDSKTAAHIGFLHVWRLSERARLADPGPTIVDHAALGRRFLQEAVALDPTDARYLGFLGSALLSEGAIHKDERLTRRGYYTLREAIDAWPEFNLFTAGYVLSAQPKGSERFKEALEWQWTTLDRCAGTRIDRQNPDFRPYMASETNSGPKRVCWNSWIAPHNFEGFFLNFGDMLVKAGEWKTAKVAYANAKHSSSYSEWTLAPVLEERIQSAENNVEKFAAPAVKRAGIEPAMMLQSKFACVACHQK
ncbi:hypothetical protein [Variovorax paradoxus]|uniref:hypothetical protein n=1 Tax=Variovorax paradoxus TaxID=34073 RepID=UPI003D653FDD